MPCLLLTHPVAFVVTCIAVSGTIYPTASVAGTAIEIGGDSTATVFQRELLPLMQAKQDLWPASVQTLEAFELYAGLVQSRAFHMLAENWITGSAQEGAVHQRLDMCAKTCCSAATADCSLCCLVASYHTW